MITDYKPIMSFHKHLRSHQTYRCKPILIIPHISILFFLTSFVCCMLYIPMKNFSLIYECVLKEYIQTQPNSYDDISTHYSSFNLLFVSINILQTCDHRLSTVFYSIAGTVYHSKVNSS